MSEMQLPERGGPPTPAPAPKPAPIRDPRAGSLALGVALAWIINIVGGAIVFGLTMLLASRAGTALFGLGWLPFLVT
ncbi:MAG TPA: hypothetical protein VJ862_12065, partial [Rhodanobacteraceae bacterium]|nr:hypothetical protein [Rhodanobacteraceae bacterium]